MVARKSAKLVQMLKWVLQPLSFASDTTSLCSCRSCGVDMSDARRRKLPRARCCRENRAACFVNVSPFSSLFVICQPRFLTHSCRFRRYHLSLQVQTLGEVCLGR